MPISDNECVKKGSAELTENQPGGRFLTKNQLRKIFLPTRRAQGPVGQVKGVKNGKISHFRRTPVKPAPSLRESFYNESLIFLSIDMGTPIKNMSIPVFDGLRSSSLKVV